MDGALAGQRRPRFCQDCGAKIGEADRFCGGCGGAVEGGDAVAPPSTAEISKTTTEDGAAARKDLRYVPFAVALAALCAVGVITFALARRGHAGGRPTGAPPSVERPRPNAYDYTLNVDLAELATPTEVRVTVEDADGVRELQRRRRSPGERFSLTARAKGEKATWRIYYDGRLVRTIYERSDGTATALSPGSEP